MRTRPRPQRAVSGLFSVLSRVRRRSSSSKQTSPGDCCSDLSFFCARRCVRDAHSAPFAPGRGQRSRPASLATPELAAPLHQRRARSACVQPCAVYCVHVDYPPVKRPRVLLACAVPVTDHVLLSIHASPSCCTQAKSKPSPSNQSPKSNRPDLAQTIKPSTLLSAPPSTCRPRSEETHAQPIAVYRSGPS